MTLGRRYESGIRDDPAIMRFQKQNAVVDITLNNSEKVPGQIVRYSGQQLTVAGRALAYETKK